MALRSVEADAMRQDAMIQRFRHEAMATTFEVMVVGPTEEYARQAAATAFRELERLESELSRFVDSSDIARANRLREGQSITIGEDAMQCLIAAARISEATGRAFDPTYATSPSEPDAATEARFALDPARHTLTSLTPRLHLDLGAVGKGYALDRMGAVLREWEIERTCLQSGGSTALALAAPESARGWPIAVGSEVVYLAHRAVSGSGIAVQGRHLIDPRTQRPAPRTERVWSLADSAADADALSTAFFVMGDAEIASFCRRHRQFAAAIAQADGTVSWIK